MRRPTRGTPPAASPSSESPLPPARDGAPLSAPGENFDGGPYQKRRHPLTDQHASRSSASHASPALTRRRFLQGSGLTAAGILGLPRGHPTQGAPAVAAASPAQAFKGQRPNFLILMVEEMGYPPIYESAVRQLRV
jgi:hypothetical protein